MKKEYAEYLLKKTTEDYNLNAERFSRAREQTWIEMRFLFDNYLIPKERVLDLGCGNGRFFEIFKEKNVDYVGIDGSEKLIEIAQKRYSEAKFQIGNALNLPFPNNYFDKVYSIAVLHHIPSKKLRNQFLKEAKRVLKKSGLLILTVWNLWQKRRTRKLIPTFTILKILGKSKLDFKDILMDWEGIENCYFHCFTKRELQKIVKKTSFKIKEGGEIFVGLEKKSKWPNSNFYIVAENNK